MIKTYLFTDTEVKEDVPLDGWQSLVESQAGLLWVDVRDLSSDDIDRLVRAFGLHRLETRSCIDGYSRPHVHEFEDHFYVNLTMVKSSTHGHGAVRPSELHLFAGDKFIITVTKEKHSEAVDKALAEYKDSKGLRSRGAMYVVYLLAEDLIETYFPMVEKLDSEADKIEDDMLNKADKATLRRLFDLKRQAFELRRLLGPQRDVFSELARRDFEFIRGENQIYFQDVYNRMIRIFDMLDTVREILSGALDIYLSTISNRLNEVMKVLTVAAIILMTLSFITGFYGMNFVHLPWLQAPHAFRNTVALMVVITVAMLWWFRRKGWV